MKRIFSTAIVSISFIARLHCYALPYKPPSYNPPSRTLPGGLKLTRKYECWILEKQSPEELINSSLFQKNSPDYSRFESPKGNYNNVLVGIAAAGWSLLSGKRNRHNEYDPRNVLHNHAQCARWSVGDFKDAMNSLIIGDTPPEQIRYPRGQFKDDYIFEDKQYLTIMRQWGLYKYENFWEFIRRFPQYEMHLEKIYKEIQSTPSIYENMCIRAQDRINKEYHRIQREPQFICYSVDQPTEKEKQKQEQEQRHASIKKTFSKHQRELDSVILEYDQLIAEETIGDFGNRKRLDERIAVIKEIQNAGAHYSEDPYALSDIAIIELQKIFCSPETYKKFYGNQLQHLIHRDCIAILEETIKLPESSPIFAYKNALIECIDSAHEFNREGQCRKAITITDFCWSFLDYGKAVIEGAANGLLGVAQHCYEHPMQTAACVIVPEVIFVYQLGKLLYDVVDIGSTALLSEETVSKEKVNELALDAANLGLATLSCKIPSVRGLHTLIAPVTHLIDLLQSGECTGPKIVKGVTQCAVGFRAQKKLFGGLGKLFNTAKVKALDFIEKNPSVDPEQYMTTPEGAILRAMHRVSNKQKNSIGKVRRPAREIPNNSKKISEAKNIPKEKPVEWTRHGGKHVSPKNVPWKDVVKSTIHGKAKYKPDIDVKKLEYHAWENGQRTTNEKTWKVFKANNIIGANEGRETCYMRVECSANTIHGHPITQEEYLGLLK